MSENSGEAFAKYHDEKAGHGGVAWEFHARAATFLRSAESMFASLREQVRALTAERDAFIASLEREAQVADELRARVAEVEKDLTATQAKFNGAAGACLALGTRATKAESARDAAQQRAKALEFCLHKMMGHMGIHAWNCALCNEARELTKEEAP